MDELGVGGQTPPTGPNAVSVTPSNQSSGASLPPGNEVDAGAGRPTDSADETPRGSNEDAQLDNAAIIQKHQRGVWRYLRMLGCDDATADDLTQETFLRVLRRKDFVQHNDNATAGYLRRTAYNLLVSRHRKLGRMQTVAEPKLLDESWNRWAGKDLSGNDAVDALQQCFEKLTERAKLALRMRFDSSASRVQIGDALGITDHGARNLMQRAKQQLRNCVEEKLKLANEQ